MQDANFYGLSVRVPSLFFHNPTRDPETGEQFPEQKKEHTLNAAFAVREPLSRGEGQWRLLKQISDELIETNHEVAANLSQNGIHFLLHWAVPFECYGTDGRGPSQSTK